MVFALVPDYTIGAPPSTARSLALDRMDMGPGDLVYVHCAAGWGRSAGRCTCRYATRPKTAKAPTPPPSLPRGTARRGRVVKKMAQGSKCPKTGYLIPRAEPYKAIARAAPFFGKVGGRMSVV